MRKRIALFDMDNTLCDYSSAMTRDLKKIIHPDEVVPLNPHAMKEEYWKERIKMVQAQPDWWFNLERLELGNTLYHMADFTGFEIHILTKGPVMTPSAWTEKLKWCQKHLGLNIPVTITQEKSLVYGRILIDDFPEYLSAWLKHRPNGYAIMPAHDYNKDFTHDRVIRYDGTNDKEVLALFEKTFQRK